MSFFQCLLLLTLLLLPTTSTIITGTSFITTSSSEYEKVILSCDPGSDCTIICQHTRGCHSTQVNCPATDNLCQITISDGLEINNREFGVNMTVNGGGGDLLINTFGHRQFKDSMVICPSNKICNISCTAITSGSTCLDTVITGGDNGDIILYGSGPFVWFRGRFNLSMAHSINAFFGGDQTARFSTFNFTYVKNVSISLSDLGVYPNNDLQLSRAKIYNSFGEDLYIIAEGSGALVKAEIFGPINGTVELSIFKIQAFLEANFHCGKDSILNVKCGDPLQGGMPQFQNECHNGNFICEEANLVNISVFHTFGLYNASVYCPQSGVNTYQADLEGGGAEVCYFTTHAESAIDLITIYAKNGPLDFKIDDNGREQLMPGGRGTLFCGVANNMSCVYGYESGSYQCISGDECDAFTHDPTPITTMDPTLVTGIPTMNPSESPTRRPSANPSINPSLNPSINPTLSTGNPSMNPSAIPTVNPSIFPTKNPSNNPSINPSFNPSLIPSNNPSFNPSLVPSNNPTRDPSMTPSNIPTLVPSVNPSLNPTNNPSKDPSFNPSVHPSDSPSNFPTFHPTSNPSLTPSKYPSKNPIEGTISPTISTNQPTKIPTEFPTINPSLNPTNMPSLNATQSPSSVPSEVPSSQVVGQISDTPSIFPSLNPSNIPTNNPSFSPSNNPTLSPIITSHPTQSPTNNPILSFPDTPTNNPTKTGAKSNKGSSNSTGIIIMSTLLPISCVIISIILLYLYYTKYVSPKQTHTKTGLHLTNSVSSTPKNTTKDTKIELKNLSHNRINSNSNNPKISPILDTANTQEIGEKETSKTTSKSDNNGSILRDEHETNKERDSDDELYESGDNENETVMTPKGDQNDIENNKMKFEDEYETIGNENVKQLDENNEQNGQNETTKSGEIKETKKDSGVELHEQENDKNVKKTSNNGETNDTQQNGEINN